MQWHGPSCSALPSDEARSLWRAHFSSPTGDSLFSDDFFRSVSLRFASTRLGFGSSRALDHLCRSSASSFWRPVARMGSSLSVLGNVFLGSSVSLRSFARLGASLSVLEARPWVLFIIVGFSRVGDSLSLFGSARYGSSLAVLGYTLGFVSIASLWSAIGRVAFDRSSMALRSCSRVQKFHLVRTFCPWLSFRDLRIVAVLARHVAIRRILGAHL